MPLTPAAVPNVDTAAIARGELILRRVLFGTAAVVGLIIAAAVGTAVLVGIGALLEFLRLAATALYWYVAPVIALVAVCSILLERGTKPAREIAKDMALSAAFAVVLLAGGAWSLDVLPAPVLHVGLALLFSASGAMTAYEYVRDWRAKRARE